MKRLIPLLVLVFCCSTALVKADKSGKTGRTAFGGEGCGDCHGLTPSTETIVKLLGIDGSSVTMAPNEVRQFTVEIAHPTMAAAGVNIAVKTTTTGTTDAGTLGVFSQSGLKNKLSELAHTAPKPMVNGSATFTFSFKAPAQLGTYFMRITGNAVNLDDVESSDDRWNFMQPLSIIVVEPTSVQDAGAGSPNVWPQPLGDAPVVFLSGLQQDVYEVAAIDAVGRMVPLGSASSNENGILELPHDVAALPKGMYTVLLRGHGISYLRTVFR